MIIFYLAPGPGSYDFNSTDFAGNLDYNKNDKNKLFTTQSKKGFRTYDNNEYISTGYRNLIDTKQSTLNSNKNLFHEVNLSNKIIKYLI